MTNPVQLSKKELNKVFWRSYQALGCYTYDKQQGISYMRALLPALQKLYPDPEDLKEALIRHNVMFNTTCAFVPFCLGITCAMEEELSLIHICLRSNPCDLRFFNLGAVMNESLRDPTIT